MGKKKQYAIPNYQNRKQPQFGKCFRNCAAGRIFESFENIFITAVHFLKCIPGFFKDRQLLLFQKTDRQVSNSDVELIHERQNLGLPIIKGLTSGQFGSLSVLM